MAEPRRLGRRHLLAGGAGAGIGAGVGFALGHDDSAPTRRVATEPPAEERVAVHGATQAGVDRPLTPATQLSFQVWHTSGALEAATWARLLGTLGERLTTLVAASPTAARLSILVGVGPRALASAGLDPALASLPTFRGSAELPQAKRTADLVLAAAADLPEAANTAMDALRPLLTEHGLERSWSQLAFRARGTGMVTHNPLGFHDGIVQPEKRNGIPERVFLSSGKLGGGTIGVVRRFEIDVPSFEALPLAEQEAVFGRTKATGAPLSGGSIATDVNLTAKTPQGEYLVPSGSHVRAAHPSFTASPVMLRRSYGFRTATDGPQDRAGLLFWSFQDDVATFARTQERMDREDRLMEFARPSAEAAFVVLPGFTPGRPLGTALFA